MSGFAKKHVAPSVMETAFNCPHCGALAKQFWHLALAMEMGKDWTPNITKMTPELEERLKEIENADQQADARRWLERRAAGVAFLHPENRSSTTRLSLENVFIARCFNCENISIWLYDRLLWPGMGAGPEAHPDLPEEIRPDYDEASAILDRSPRGAAALLRLVIQKICIHLKQPGENLNEDIGALVKLGLPVKVQMALDTVRVIGGQAVHPLEMDMRDDRPTAESLFGLVNTIVEVMIANPKHIDAVYKLLPPTKIEQIARRDTPRGTPLGPKKPA